MRQRAVGGTIFGSLRHDIRQFAARQQSSLRTNVESINNMEPKQKDMMLF